MNARDFAIGAFIGLHSRKGI